MGLRERVNRLEQSAREQQASPVMPEIVEVVVENRSQIELVKSLPPNCPIAIGPGDSERALAFFEYAGRIDTELYRPEDKAKWAEQITLSRRNAESCGPGSP